MVVQATLLSLVLLCVEAHVITDSELKLLSVDIPNVVWNQPFKESTVKFYFYKPYSQGFVDLVNRNLYEIDFKAATVVIIHGWKGHPNETWILDLCEVYSQKSEKYNIIVVDWSKSAKDSYAVAVGYAGPLGIHVGKLIKRLQTERGIDIQSVTLIGHFDGAHVAGLAGMFVDSETQYKVKYIIGLDPAGPVFDDYNVYSLRIDYGDLVIALHTDMGALGTTRRSGKIDLYANGGTPPQPGCELKDLKKMTSCSHDRAPQLLVAMLKHPSEFFMTKCRLHYLYEHGFCDSNMKIRFSELTPQVPGMYFFRTTGQPPYFKRL